MSIDTFFASWSLPTFSRVGLKLTWCQPFGVQGLPKSGNPDSCTHKKAILRCFLQKKSIAVSSRSFDLLKSMIYDLKRSFNLRKLFNPVLHSSLDDLVLLLLTLFLPRCFWDFSWPSSLSPRSLASVGGRRDGASREGRISQLLKHHFLN